MHASIIYDKCSHEQFQVKIPGVKRGRWSFTFEYKLKVIAHADEIGNRRINDPLLAKEKRCLDKAA